MRRVGHFSKLYTMGNTVTQHVHPKRWEGAYIECMGAAEDASDFDKLYARQYARYALVHFVGCAGTAGYDEDIRLSDLDLSVDFRDPQTGLWTMGELVHIKNRRVKTVKAGMKVHLHTNADVAPLYTHTLQASELYVGKIVDALVHPHGKANKHLWVEAKILKIRYTRLTRAPKKILLHFVGHDKAWDEWVPPTPAYIARLHTYSDTSRFHVHDTVRVHIHNDDNDYWHWQTGTIQELNDTEARVAYEVHYLRNGRPFASKTWFTRVPLNSPRMILVTKKTEYAVAAVPRVRAKPRQITPDAADAAERSLSDRTPLPPPYD